MKTRRVDNSSMAVCSAFWLFSLNNEEEDNEEEDRDLEKKTHDVSSMGWNTTRATSEPAVY